MASLVRQSSLTSLDPLKRNFKNFLYKAWMTWFGQAPQSIMYDFADRLQYGPDKDILMGYRGLAKSYITVTCCGWVHHNDPAALILNLAGSGNSASGNAYLYWGMINKWDWLSHLKPSGMLRYAATAFDVQGSAMEKSESFASMSVFSGDKTGRRADFVLPDDVETPTTSSTEGERIDLRRHLAEATSAVLRTDRWGWVKMLGTPQTEATIYTEMATDKGYGMRIWPVLYPKPEELPHYGPWLDPNVRKAVTANPLLANTSTTPARFSEADILQRRIEWGETEFKRQFLLWTDIGGGVSKPLKLRDIPVINLTPPTSPHSPVKVPSELRWDPCAATMVPDLQVHSLNGDSHMYFPADTLEFREYWQAAESIILQVDPSGTGTDETAYGVLIQHVGRIFVADQGFSLEGFTDPTLRAIAHMAKRWGVHKVKLERNFGGGMFGALLRPILMEIGHDCIIEEEFATGAKEARIVDALETLISMHRLVFALEVLLKDWSSRYDTVGDLKQMHYHLTYQLTRITKEKGILLHDDRIDWVASGVRSFLGPLARQVADAAKQSREMEINKEVDYLIASQAREQEAMQSVLSGVAKVNGFRIGDSLVRDTGGLTGSPLFRGRA